MKTIYIQNAYKINFNQKGSQLLLRVNSPLSEFGLYSLESSCLVFLGLRDHSDAPGHGDEDRDIVLLSAFPGSIVGLLVLALVRRLLALWVLELLDGGIGEDSRKPFGFAVRGDLFASQLLSEVFDDGEYLMLEQIVKHAIGGRDDDVTVLEVNGVVIGAIRLILAHMVLLLEDLAQSGELITLALLAQNVQVSLGWQLGKLVWNVEGMLLLLRSSGYERLTLLESDHEEA